MKIVLQRKTASRHGATLVEVLMSLMIFSVGIVSVFALFPIGLLSSIQATKLTNSKILADNVVEYVRASPESLHPPGIRNATAANNWTGEWNPNTAYAIGDLVWPDISSGNLFPTPNLTYRCSAAGTSGGAAPTWKTSGTISDGTGSLEWLALSLNSANENYVVDPLGRHFDAVDDRKAFGYNGTTELTFGGGGLSRTDGSFRSFSTAREFFTQPDSWTVVFDVVPAAVNATSVSVPSSVDLGGVSSANHRVVITADNGKEFTVRELDSTTPVSNKTINLAGPNLPANMNTAGEVSKIRLEAFAPRYSYLMTVRRADEFLQPKVSVAIIFNRSFSTLDEEVYDANFGNQAYDDVAEVDGSTPNNIQKDQVRISWSGKKKPLLREGKFLFDARAAIWYKILDVADDDSAQKALITLDRPVEVITQDTGTASDVGRAILMPGIVNVFEL